jgi:DNA-binding MarR family transcriptional regulator
VNIAGTDPETRILEMIRGARKVRQRDLAHGIGLSLGMTNAILKRLAVKGLIVVRKVNNRNVRYAVSPAGLEQIARRSYRYLRRTIRDVVDYRRAIEALVQGVRRAGYARIVLSGQSDLDFILEHACAAGRVELRREEAGAPSRRRSAGTFVLYSERRSRPARLVETEDDPASAYLGELLAGLRPRRDERGARRRGEVVS